jgi:hypothetical protein
MSSRNKTCVSSSSVRRDDVVQYSSTAQHNASAESMHAVYDRSMYVCTCMYVRYVRTMYVLYWTEEEWLP